MKKRLLSSSKISFLCLGLGLSLCLAPSLWTMFSHHQAAKDIQTYQKEIETISYQDFSQSFEQATLWNQALNGQIRLERPLEKYEEQLQLLGDGVMGILSIPKLTLELPIYHGVEEEALSKGVGHLPSSSLPIGSSSARVVLSAHRGLMQAELFTRLDELEIGDCFWIENPRETLAYKVRDIQVILPNEKKALAIEEGQDLVTLMTCTPYGINDHRLLVTGSRIPWQESQEQRIQEKEQFPTWIHGSWREICFRLWPWLVVLLVVILLIWRKHQDQAKDYFRKED